MGYREDLEISKFELAELWETHQMRFMDWAEKLAESIEEKDEIKLETELDKAKAKDELESVKAHLDLQIRTNYEYFGLKKAPTEKLVESLIAKSPEFVEAKQKYYAIMEQCGKDLAKAEYNVNVLKAAKDAFEHRKTALDNLTRLMVGGFYSARLPKDLAPEIKEEREKKLDQKARDSANESIRRRRRQKGEMNEKLSALQ